jgi:hypothetical protein
MARSLRIQYFGSYYLKMNRGKSREDIFLTDKVRQFFVDGLADSCETYKIRLITYFYLNLHF